MESDMTNFAAFLVSELLLSALLRAQVAQQA